MAQTSRAHRAVNNDLYQTLGTRWYEADDDPVALLRAESKLRNPWVAETMTRELGARKCPVLDIGCGAGFLSNYLVGLGYPVTGLDAAPGSLEVARKYDKTGAARYDCGDARALPYKDATFDVVCAMDFLEHVEEPARVIAEAARVLRPNGLFFFHTFNRNWLSWLVAIKGVEWFIHNTPNDMHVLRLFLKPKEVQKMCGDNQLEIRELLGVRPKLSAAFARMLATGYVRDDFAFKFSHSTRLAYTGFARKMRRGAKLHLAPNIA